MLDRGLIYRDAFNKLNLVDKTYIHCLDAFEWEMVEKIRDVLGPFYDITELFSGSDYPTSNLYFENVWRISMLLKEVVKVQSHDEVLRDMTIEMQKKFDKYWAVSDEDNYGTLFAFAMVLDPRCKLHFLKYCYKKLFDDELKAQAKVNDIQFKMVMLLSEYKRQNTPSASSSSSNAEPRVDYDCEGVDSSSDKSRLSTYLEDDRLDRKIKLDVLEYWKKNEDCYGELARLARDILSVPLTTVASESTFSIGGRVLNKWRSSYIPENVEALITTRSWLYGYQAIEEDEFQGVDVEWSTVQSSS
ncbi:zinc finger BED domain-containing protein RICESLEEPER 1-like [Silene latifolia]|uniref:zinc finger BED domain-containing protein RICESLEEPER 1-like n=1 Tax=Silene latifolia TaxID=37657 RepID=UPI003D77DE26